MGKVSCLICAYNEAGRIERVLTVASKHPLIQEVVVVDDGSSDGTADIAKKFRGVRVLALKKNGGKTHALLTGFLAIKSKHILTLDADLVGLTAKNITDLIEPVLQREAAMSMSLRGNSLRIFRLFGIDFVSGERVFAKSLLDGQLPKIKKLPRFGFEVFLNDLFIPKKQGLKVVDWKKVSHVRKSEKMGWLKGNLAELKMLFDLLRTVGFIKLFSQNIRLLRLRARG